MSKKVVIVIPTYNEELAISSTISGIFANVKNVDTSKYSIEVLIFDSASKDNTVAVVKNLQQQYNPGPGITINLVQEDKKSGLGSAYMQAIGCALDDFNADIVFEYDADGSHDPCYLLPMLNSLEQGADVVVGSRYVAGGGILSDWGWHRKLLSSMGNVIARFLLSKQYQDYTSGFRASKACFLRKVNLKKLLSKDYAYKLHLFWELHLSGANIVEHPIMFKDREQGESKLPANSIIDSLRVLFVLRYRMHKLYIKTCLVGLVGFCLQFVIYNSLRFFMTPLISVFISIECAILLNFTNNNYFTFNKNKFLFSNAKQFSYKLGKFNVLSIGSIILQMLFLGVWHHIFQASRIEENIAMFLGIFFGSMINYYVYRRWVWKVGIDGVS